jgi:hypothetical protein
MTDDVANLIRGHSPALRVDIAEMKRRMGNFETELMQQGKLVSILADGQSHISGPLAEIDAAPAPQQSEPSK